MNARRLSTVVSVVIAVSSILPSCTSKTADGGASGNGASGGAVPEPLRADSGEVLAYVAIPSIDGLVRDVVTFGDAVQPGAVSEQMLTARVGAMVGDPSLSSLHRDRPIVILVLKGDSRSGSVPPMVAFLPTKEGSPIEQSVGFLGMQARRSKDALLVAQTPQALARGEDLRSVYERIASARSKDTALLYVHTGRVLGAYRPLLDAQLAALSGMAGMLGAPAGAGGMSIGTLLKAEVLGLLAVLGQLDETQVAVDLSEDGISVDSVVVARRGSAMAKFFTGSGEKSGRPLACGDGTSGGVAGSCSIDARGLSAMAKEIVRELAKDRELGALLTPELTDMWTGVGDWWAGTAQFEYGFSDRGLSYAAVLGVTDGTKLVDILRDSVRMSSQGGFVSNLYRSLGMNLSAESRETTREHAGVSIHEWTLDWKAAGLGEEMAAALEWMPRGWSFAVVDGQALLSTDARGMDRMIDQAKSGRESGRTLEATRVFGKGRQAYLDFDFLGILTSLARVGGSGAAPLQVLAQNAPDSAPLSTALSFAENRMRFQTRVPSGLVQAFAMIGAGRAGAAGW